MSEQEVKDAIAGNKLICPQCSKPMKKYEKYQETIDSVRDGFNVVTIDSYGVRVTLTCGNDPCAWKERTEFWSTYLAD